MPIEIEGVEYFTAADIHRMLGITRQTLWRWRTARKIPQGRRYRDRNIVFTHQELEAIREYANRLEPADSPQLRRLSGASTAAPKGDA
jgi:predicted DNA-binding transcriptional regulator AlpA